MAWASRPSRGSKSSSAELVSAAASASCMLVSVELGRLCRGPAGADDDLFHAQPGRFELLLAGGLQGRATLIDLDGFLQRRLAALQFADDLFQLGKRLLERQAGDIGGCG